MLSHRIQSFLEREVVGQSRAVNTLTRSLTVALSGIDSLETPIGSYLFLGPSGTGKSHLARALARMLGGQSDRLAVVDCNQFGGGNDLQAMAGQIAPHFQKSGGNEDGHLAMPRPSILLVENLEAAKRGFVQALLGMIETGTLRLSEGHQGSLAGCLVLLTSNLCAGEIYGEDRQEIGFSTGALDLEERERARIYEVCASAVEKRWGSVLVGHLDDLIVFHRLRQCHFPLILERQLETLNERLASRRIRVEIEPEARAYLLERGAGYPRHGAWFLVKSFRRYVVFPVADMVADGTTANARVQLELDEERRLRFVVRAQGPEDAPVDSRSEWSIPIDWEETPVLASSSSS